MRYDILPLLAITCLVSLCATSSASAQDPNARERDGAAWDTSAVYDHDAVVVTAERAPTRLAASTAGVSLLTGEELRRLPARTLSDALRQMPGFAFLDFDGMGRDPQPIMRGFYGGGEAEYVLMLVDGVPVNGVRDGRINWDLIPLSAVEAVEVVRGGASAVWGDVAQAGVINVITRRGPEAGRLSVSADDVRGLEGAGSVAGEPFGRSAAAWTNLGRSRGYRDHAERRDVSAGGSLDLVGDDGLDIGLSLLHHWRRFDEPGPLTEPVLADSRRASLPFFRFDATREHTHRAGLNALAELSPSVRGSGHLAAEAGSADIVRTLPLAPTFFDTQARDLDTRRLFGSAQIEVEQASLGPPGRLVLGADFAIARLHSEYRRIRIGGADAYADGEFQRGDPLAAGRGSRANAATFFRYEARPLDRLRVVLGGRLDWLSDAYEPSLPAGGDRLEASHTAVSPELGLNLQYLARTGHDGHVYASVARSFKAPTLDQLFDQRSVPVDPQFSITLSNELLDPQRGINAELGVYHRSDLIAGVLGTELSLSAYQIDLKEEIDFSLEEFRYVNIGESRRRGVEAGLKLRGPRGTEGFANYTLQNATARTGEHAGRYLKAVPRRSLSTGLSATHGSRLTGAVVVNRAHDIYLDDANALELPGFTRLDARVSYPLGRLRVGLDAQNLLDRKYESTGYPIFDPAGPPAIFYFPAAGRVLRVQLSSVW